MSNRTGAAMCEEDQMAEAQRQDFCHQRTYDWIRSDIPISRPDLSDTAVASSVRMLMRDQLDHEAVCVMARDRIMALVKEKAALEAEISALRAIMVEPND